MRPLRDRKSCEEHLIAHFQWQFLKFRIVCYIPFLFFCDEPTYELGSYRFLPEGGPSVCGRGPEFFGVVKGGEQFEDFSTTFRFVCMTWWLIFSVTWLLSCVCICSMLLAAGDLWKWSDEVKKSTDASFNTTVGVQNLRTPGLSMFFFASGLLVEVNLS